MKVCPECRFTAADYKRFCYRDGHALVALDKRCQCGLPLGAHDRYCEECGAKYIEKDIENTP